jgi:tetratricopeptide (TPR) repeat protein
MHLREILRACSGALSTHDIAERVLPEDGAMLLEAARSGLLVESPGAVRVLLEKALRLLEHPGIPLSADQMRDKAEIHRDLGQTQEAIEAYQAALALKPGQTSWRFELVRLLHQQDRLDDVRRELRTILTQQPGHQGAKDLYQSVVRQQIER